MTKLVEVNREKKELTIDININGSYIVSNGTVVFVPMPQSGYGEHKIHWLGGKRHHVDNTERVKG